MDDSSESLSSASSVSNQQQILPSEVQLLRAAIGDSIQSLFKLSVAIRKPTLRDRYAKDASLPTFDPLYDTAHIWEKFPKARDAPWLIERLAKANVRRRQHWQYQEYHRERLPKTYGYSSSITGDGQSAIERITALLNAAIAPVDETRTVINSIRPSDLYRTFENTFFSPAKKALDFENGDNQLSEADAPSNSSATSVEEQDSDKISIPPLPGDLPDMYNFECPICFKIQVKKSEASWKSHVMRDLQPWICTAEDCSSRTYETSHEWFDHEMLEHRKQLYCLICQQQVETELLLLEHMQSVHASNYGETQMPALIEMSYRQVPSIDPKDCPFCDEWAEIVEAQTLSIGTRLDPHLSLVTPRQFRNHLGHHLREIAMFSLPRSLFIKDDREVDSNAAAKTTNEEQVSDMLSRLESTVSSEYGQELDMPVHSVGSPHTSLSDPNVPETYETDLTELLRELKIIDNTDLWLFERAPHGGLPGKSYQEVMSIQQNWAIYYKLDPDDLTKLAQDEVSKQQALHEIIVSEAQYRVELDVLKDVFLTPLCLLQAPRFWPEVLPKVERIKEFAFGDVKAMTAASDSLLAKFEQCQQREGPMIKSLGIIINDFFVKYERIFFKYAAILPHILSVIRDLIETSVEIETLFGNAQQDTRAKRFPWDVYFKSPITHCRKLQSLSHSALETTIDSTQRVEIEQACNRIQSTIRQVDSEFDLWLRRASLEDLASRISSKDSRRSLSRNSDLSGLLSEASQSQGLILQSSFIWQEVNVNTNVFVFLTNTVLLIAERKTRESSLRRNHYFLTKVCLTLSYDSRVLYNRLNIGLSNLATVYPDWADHRRCTWQEGGYTIEKSTRKTWAS